MITADDIRPGTTLPNGAVVIKAQPISTQDRTWLILAIANPGFPDAEYITWEATDTVANTYWGHYHRDDLDGALKDYTERAYKVLT